MSFGITESPKQILTRRDIEGEIVKCAIPNYQGCNYFAENYVYIQDYHAQTWIDFKPWDHQRDFMRRALSSRKVIALKARQLGLTWDILVMDVWQATFHGNSSILLFSKDDDAAIELLKRIKGIILRLPPWMQLAKEGDLDDNKHVLELSNGSMFKSFSTRGGDSFTGTCVNVDEADLVPNLRDMLRAVEPTMAFGGKLRLISRSNQDEPNSHFKKIFRAAASGNLEDWDAVFYPWHCRYSQEFYDKVYKEKDSIDDLDYIREQYPATAEEAMSARTASKRFKTEWVEGAFSEVETLDNEGPAIPGLRIYRKPAGGYYVLGIDSAEGLRDSDDSCIIVIDFISGEEVASIWGKIEPSILAGYATEIADYYNGASVMSERNDHGRIVIKWLEDNTKLHVLPGPDGRAGWLTNQSSKIVMFTQTAEILRKSYQSTEPIIHTRKTKDQLQSIDRSELRAPTGMNDDLAVGFCLAQAARAGGTRAGTQRSTWTRI